MEALHKPVCKPVRRLVGDNAGLTGRAVHDLGPTQRRNRPCSFHRWKIERPAQDRVKTDQRDAERVLRLLMIDALHAVRVPGGEEEALRDLIRAREDLRGDLMRARQRLSKLLLRHDIRYEDTASAWTARHRAWLTRIDLGQAGAQATLLDYIGAVDTLVLRRDSLEASISQLVPGSPWADTAARLRCLRGIDTLSPVGAVCRGRRLRAF